MDPAEVEEVLRFVELGTVLAGKYRLERLIGVGGMGAVVAAKHETLGETVAIKFLLPRVLGMRRHTARFLREARAVSRLKSAHVARVFDVDQRPDGTPFIVMEYLTGETLATRLSRGRPQVAEIVDELLEACEAVAEAHSLGIVHRDLKPANLFLARGAGNVVSVKVLDFGISKHVGEEPDSHDATTGEGLLGSPPYMSPEQFTSPADVDHRTDIWSLGVVLYQGLSGKAPFTGENFAALCAQVLQARPPALATSAPELPRSLVDIVDRCLVKERERRFPDVLALARALAEHGTTRGRRPLAVIESMARAAPPASAREDGVDTGALGSGTLTATAGSATEAAGPRSNRRAGLRLGRWLLPAATLLGGAAWLASRPSTSVGPALPNDAALPSSPARAAAESLPRASADGSAPAPPASVREREATASPAPAPLTSGHMPPGAAASVAIRRAAPRPTPSAPAPPPAPRAFDPIFDERR